MGVCKNCGKLIDDEEEYCEDCKEDEEEDEMNNLASNIFNNDYLRPKGFK